MLYTPNAKVPRYLILPPTTSTFISSHFSNNGVITYTYTIPIKVDTASVKSLDGSIILRAFSSRKKPEKIVIKTSTIAGSNIIKSIDRQKIEQSKLQSLKQKFFFEKYIDAVDLSSPEIEVQIEVSTSQISDTFTIEAVNEKSSGKISSFDSTEINHTQALQKYDLPNGDFLLTTTRNERRKIFVAASTDDSNTGYFRFFLRKDSGTTLKNPGFTSSLLVPVGHTNIASANFTVDDTDLQYTVRAHPVSAILKQEIGNFKQETAAFVKGVKQLAFHMTALEDRSVTFNVVNISPFIEKIFLYRRSSLSHDREFVISANNIASSVLVVDEARQPQYDYIYTIDYLDRDGNTVTCPTEVIVLSLKLDTLAKIKVTQVALSGSSSQSNLSFNATVDYDTSTLYDQLYSDVKSLGVESIFSSDLKKMTNNLKPITRVLVSRISLITGTETNIGAFPAGTITVANEDADPCIFRFEVAVRSAPEALENLTAAQSVLADNSFNQKSAVDLTSKLIGNLSKTSRTSFSSKFFSRSSLKDSTIKYGSASSLADISYYAGRTGIFSDILISKPVQNSVVVKDIRSLLTKRGNYIIWTAIGDLSTVDYFSIVADDESFKSQPVQKSTQRFYIGNRNPKKISVTSVQISATIT
jgi:hypothetical protein